MFRSKREKGQTKPGPAPGFPPSSLILRGLLVALAVSDPLELEGRGGAALLRRAPPTKKRREKKKGK